MANRIRHTVPIMLVTLFICLCASSALAQTSTPRDPAGGADLRRLHPDLRRAILAPDRAGDFVPIIVERRQGSGVFAQAAAGLDKLAQRRAIIAALQADAAQQAAALSAALDAAVALGQARNVRAFWASPVIALEAQPALIASLAAREDVVQVRPDARFMLEEIAFEPVAAAGDPHNLPWNLDMLDVELAQLGLNLDGTGVTVANLDTGVDWQHPALLTKYRGYRGRELAVHWGNWHVSTQEPYFYPGDGSGHGTHVMGTLVGDDGEGNRIGVAPGARWIAVKLFDNAGGTYESWIHDAFEWIMAPEGDPVLAPDVVNNSWGSDFGSDERFRPAVQALRAAGILPIFSAGNNGPGAGTVDSPGSFPEAFAVGAVDTEKMIARFSGRGPSPWSEVKPEVVAPGVEVVSAFPGGGYRRAQGTSMATPHVAGVAALLLQANPTLTPGQLESVLIMTAQPLSAVIPNQLTGWGLVNAYAAGIQVTASGELVGRVIRADGAGIANAIATAAGRNGEPPVTVSGDAGGAFRLALRPGRYDVTAEAFSFAPATRYNIEVAAGARIPVTFTLQPLPSAAIFGRITDQKTGAPLTATIEAVGKPAQAHTDPRTGLYSLALPAGDYELAITADAHRIARRAVTLDAGTSVPWDVELPPAPRILLVDSGRWYYDSQAAYFSDALDALGYPFDTWAIRDPYGLISGVDDRPQTRDLLHYDAVIWSAPSDSPGLIELGPVLAGYLQAGGHLLISGEDVAYWDGGGTPFSPEAAYLVDWLSVRFSQEGNLGDLAGAAGTPFAGLTLALNTPDSAQQQMRPDSAKLADPLLAGPALLWPDGALGGVTAGVCRPYRAAWLGFGLEGAGPRGERIDALARFLDWFAAAPAPHGLAVTGDAGPLIGLPGTTVSQTLRLNNIGAEADVITLTQTGGAWPLALTLPDGSHITATLPYTVSGCSNTALVASIAIPAAAPRDAFSTHVLRFSSQGDPTASTTITVTAKTPAPVLLVDDERWYHFEDRYTTTLAALGISFDRVETGGGTLEQGAALLSRYPMVVWWTGYDWHQPLTATDEANLAAFLDGGGRLLLSSQDLMDVNGGDAFVRERLGVVGATYNITPTEISGINGGPLGENLGPWALGFPYLNWGDGLAPAATARATVHDAQLYTVGVARPADAWRTAFFAFPLETLDAGARRTLLSRTLLWLSPLGESRLFAPPAVAEASRIPITLTLGLAGAAPRDGVEALLPLPPEAALMPGSLHGPWTYDAADHVLTWTGALAPGASLVLGAELQLAAGIPDGTILPLAARLYAGDNLPLIADAPVQVDVPWLTLSLAAPAEAYLGDLLDFELHATNAGVIDTAAWLTETLPAGLTLVPGSAWASLGDITPAADHLRWTAMLAPGATAVIRFQAAVTLLRPGARLVSRADLSDDRGRRTSAWTAVRVPARLYFPLLLRGLP